jgi:hypothetical protein
VTARHPADPNDPYPGPEAEPEDDDSEIAWDEWMAMSDAQRDAMHDGALRDYNAMIDAMTRDQYYAYRRQKRVTLCLKWRDLIRNHDMPFLQDNLRRAQRMLLELRVERRTGMMSGSA